MVRVLLIFAATLTVADLFSQQTVTGTVQDRDDFPLTGVYVTVRPGGNGTATGIDGDYEVRASAGDTLVFSFIGYATHREAVGNRTQIDVTLNEDAQLIDEVVVVGYGVTKKSDLVASVSQVKGEVLENQPVSRLDQALQGRATGVSVTANDGAPGAGTTIRIRGTNSINGNNNPLFVIDGFIAGNDFNLNTLNVNDIASIEVLKDATALAIYGTRGASGVVLVTTKTGADLGVERPVISINQYYSVQHAVNQIEVLKGADYARYSNEAAQFVPGADGFGATDPSLPLVFDDPTTAPSTDWLNLITQTGRVVNTDLSIRGNTGRTNYYVSLNRFDQQGVLKNSGFQRYSLRTNLDFKINDRFTSGIRVNFARTDRENNKVNYGEIVRFVLPTRRVYDDDGEFTATNPVSTSVQRNPVADQQLRVDRRYDNDLLANAYLQFEPVDGLTLKTSIGASISSFKSNFYLPGSLPERRIDGIGGRAQISTVESNELLNENTVNYAFDVGQHGFNLLGGFSLQRNQGEGFGASAERFPNDVVEFNNLAFGSDPSTYQVSSSFSQRTFVSLFARANYSFAGKYLVSLTGRRDGSSVFEEGNKYAFFPSVGLAWNVHSEDFLSGSGLISRLKLRASLGEVGEQGVPIYNSIARFSNVSAYFNESLVNGVLIGSLPSRDLTWETTRQIDVGVELGLWQDRLFMEVDYYRKTTEDLLLNRDLPGTAGNRQLQNIGSIRNQGIEVAIRSFNISNGDFSWETQLTLSANRNKVLDLGGDEFINLRQPNGQAGAGVRLIPGQPAPVFVGAIYLGTYKDRETIVADGAEGRAFLGSPRYLDRDGNGVINDLDYVIIGNPQADLFGGIRNSFNYKGLSLDVFFQGSYGNDGFNGIAQTALFGRGDENLLPGVVGRWQEGVTEGSDIPRAGTSTSLFNPNSTLGIEDASFLRLKTVTLSYDLPVARLGIDGVFRNLSAYVTGNNVFLITDWSFGDPEVSGYGTGLEQGVATGQYPYARSFTFGLNASF